MPSFLVSRLAFDGSPQPLAVCPSREAANKLIADLEAADPKGSLIFYSRVPMKESDSTEGFRVSKLAAAMSLWAD
jgi:hypothetical protein